MNYVLKFGGLFSALNSAYALHMEFVRGFWIEHLRYQEYLESKRHEHEDVPYLGYG